MMHEGVRKGPHHFSWLSWQWIYKSYESLVCEGSQSNKELSDPTSLASWSADTYSSKSWQRNHRIISDTSILCPSGWPSSIKKPPYFCEVSIFWSNFFQPFFQGDCNGHCMAAENSSCTLDCSSSFSERPKPNGWETALLSADRLQLQIILCFKTQVGLNFESWECGGKKYRNVSTEGRQQVFWAFLNFEQPVKVESKSYNVPNGSKWLFDIVLVAA